MSDNLKELITELLGTRGRKLPHSVIGKRNCGLPSFADCAGIKHGPTKLPLQPKPLDPVVTSKMGKLSLGTKVELTWEECRKILEEPGRYRNVPKAELNRSSCTLNAEQTQYLIGIDFWELLTPEQVKEIMGVCKVFTRDETWKNPPRARIITWTWTVNQDEGMRVQFDLFNQSQVRHLVHEGEQAASIDGKAAFNQFCYTVEVGMYHCVHTPLGWCRVKRSAMGARPSCFVANTALDVLAAHSRTVFKTYIDNLLFVGKTDDLVHDLEKVRERAAFANYTFNEDLSNPSELIHQELEFLGVILNFRDKKVSLGEKVIQKLATVWTRQREWTVRDFIVCVCILVYTSNVLGRRMSRWQLVLQVWAQMQGETMSDPSMLNAPLVVLNPAVLTELEEWVGLTLTNEPLDVPKKGIQVHDFIVVTDASGYGWSGIILSCKTGQTTVVRGTWPGQHLEMLKHSTTAEPLAVALSINTFFDLGATAKVLVISDNTATVGELNKGYGTKPGRFLAQHLGKRYPHLDVDAEYYPGEAIPTDEGSRGLALNRKKLDDLAASKALTITSIREIVM